MICKILKRLALSRLLGTAMLVVLLTPLMFSVRVQAESAKLDPIKVSLVTSVSQVKPSTSFSLGILFKVEPGWHVYWKNPGDSGLPTRIKYGLPEGFSAGDIQWPLPITFTQPGEIVGFGYEHSLLLPSLIETPAIFPGNHLEFTADVAWLACSHICVPGKQKLSVMLTGMDAGTGGENPLSPEAPLFKEWSERLPKSESELNDLFHINTSGTFNKNLETGVYTYSIEWKTVALPIEFYPVPGKNLEVSNLKNEVKGNVTTLSFSVRHLVGKSQLPAEMETLLVAKNQDGSRVGTIVGLKLQ